MNKVVMAIALKQLAGRAPGGSRSIHEIVEKGHVAEERHGQPVDDLPLHDTRGSDL